MFGNTKPLASLSSGLLARKGQARPAMRPQGFHSHAMNLEDLGWNDMGDAEPSFAPATAPAPIAAPVVPISPVAVEEPVAEVPPVLVEREKLAEEFAPDSVVDAEVKQVSSLTAQRIRREVHACKPKAAFTLRLDHDRHLRLRLAVATRNRSAQALVTEALDALLASLPEVDDLARALPALKTARSSGEKR
jgi:hypothetical protein